MTNIAIVAGGSGGHIFPGIAIAQVLSHIRECEKIIFLGKKGGIEEKIVKEYEFPFFGIDAEGLVGKNIICRLKASYKILGGIKESIGILRKQRIHLVLATGSYVSVPVVLAAKYIKLPIILQEQNVVPGKANQFLSRFAQKICLGYLESEKYFPEKKCLFTGNPVRSEILNLKRKTQGEKRILILGGSQGARAINEAVCAAWYYLKEKNFYFIHQTGEKDFLWVKRFYEENHIKGKVFPFLKNMTSAYKEANLVISRAGAITLAEITLLGLPSILIPYPWAIGHQLYNANLLAEKGAAVVIKQKDLSGKKLAHVILELLNDNGKLKKMSMAALSLARPKASEDIANLCIETLKEEKYAVAMV
ncbi:MAG TPA: undecaprenyldiphospho-muramoylpentapeptide beta-N-acetylglucosaminyltransferase [Candidatus Desulfofervidus auxilii]|uniref:UDP-N-acetylglucosamine--N-acetylmuramyl-(pentapeptide) pyrophosphoryl-undecaprenol N-acetylglucosamine transferase n=1 Tax=Desulfofervidus auxilii TaxID=1621989 RepID=A0A7V0IA56_DESA2|nr:undecaprenyldiphospho-muramoylpentapeptide beta-N-acetylglucosaminyltransferase [Candidatus Desulfofervidus auxilii]